MKKIVKVLLAATVILAGCERPSTNSETGIASAHISLPVQSGDLVFRAGKGRWSSHFRDMSQRDKRFSHVGVVAVDESGFIVVHASADDSTGFGAVSAEPIATFIAGHDDIAIFRVRSEQALRDEIASLCISKIGAPFDSRFDLSNQDAVYCTELVWFAVNTAMGKEMIRTTTVKGVEIVAVDDCYSGPWVDKVYDSKQDLEPSCGWAEF
ncbi:MAG: YiiX/YebB-like N1pC/P60 family cysteine hydrolase [Candidatus Hydrogenedentales bacterium]